MVSFIVPVYNAAQYLERCITSIIAQTNSDWELILIDDGSTDLSNEICDSFSNKDKRITSVHKKNEGVSAARNDGIRLASGKWIVFVDADDFITNNYVELINEFGVNRELLLFNYNMNKVESINNHVECVEINDNEELMAAALHDNKAETKIKTALYSPWAKAYRKDFILKNKIWFTDGMKIGEDLIFNLKVYSVCKFCGYITQSVYTYVINYNSTIHKYIIDMEKTDYLFLSELKKIIRKHPRLDILYYRSAYTGLLSCLRRQIFHPENKENYKCKVRNAKRLVSKSPYREALNNYDELKNMLSKKDLFLIMLCKKQYFWLLYVIYGKLVVYLKRY